MLCGQTENCILLCAELVDTRRSGGGIFERTFLFFFSFAEESEEETGKRLEGKENAVTPLHRDGKHCAARGSFVTV